MALKISSGLSHLLFIVQINFSHKHYFVAAKLLQCKSGSPTPGPRTCVGLWSVRNQATQQEVSGGPASEEASSVFTATPHHSHYHLSSASCQHYGEFYNYFIIYYNVIIIEIKCTINVMCLNHPKTTPPLQFCGKVVFHETGPWCQKGWGPLV